MTEDRTVPASCARLRISLTATFNRFDAAPRHVHETAGPEVVIFEFSYVGSANGRSFAVPCIFVARVRDGVIVESRDYADHVGMARTFGRLHDLATALAADSGGDTSFRTQS